MKTSVVEKAQSFDRYGLMKKKVDFALSSLEDFRKRYNFVEKPDLIESLNPDDIFDRNKLVSKGAIQLSMEIFEAMGLIVPVTYPHPVTNELLPGYRRAQESDVWSQSQEENGL